MLPDKCSHGVTWKALCRECEYISDIETIRRFAPIVDNAMRRVIEYQATQPLRKDGMQS